MSTKKTYAKREQGNAVALTLLGLSVAILAGVAVLYFIGRAKPQARYTPQPVADSEMFTEEASMVNPREGWGTYVSESYEFSLQYPQGWVIATGTLISGEPVVSVYPATEQETSTTVFGLHDEVSHVSIYPLGVATEGIVGEKKASEVIIQIPQAAAHDFVLKTGRPWATVGTFDTSPISWNEAGFIFARTRIEEEERIYMRDETEISEAEYDPLRNDRVERVGFIDSSIREAEEEILKSFAFTDKSTGQGTDEVSENTDRVEIEHPEYREILTSPFTVQGKIFGTWYFENDLSLRLQTSDGIVLTEVPVALTKNTVSTEEYIPFEVSLVFETPSATSGELILGRTGSFDLPFEATNNKVVPVVFDNE